MGNILFKAMLSKIQKDILENKEELEKIYEIDTRHCKMEFELKKLVEIIEYYKDVEIAKKNEKTIFFCNGNPYIVLNLILIAICQENSIEIEIDDTMLGINTLILKIINKVILDNNISISIELAKNSKTPKAIFIDRINDYNVLKENYREAKLIPYQSIDVYLDNEKYYEIFETIYNYAISQNIEINLFEEEGMETMVKYGKGRKMLFLVDKKRNIKIPQNKKVFVNENPFSKEEIIFENDIIKELL